MSKAYKCEIIASDQHDVPRKGMTNAAIRTLYGLHEAGYQSYLVGGAVRDLLLGGSPKDFDVATDATPEEVQEVFRRCRLIGRRFRIAHVRFGGEIIEVTTFRGGASDGEDEDGEHRRVEDGRILCDNVFGTLEEDALRRDFTVNALYYSIADFSIRDFAGGMADLQSRQMQLIGDPEVRYREDPVRMLRAARLAAKLKFDIAPDSLQPIAQLAGLLDEIPPARLFDESLKLFMAGYAVLSFHKLEELGLLCHLFPALAKIDELGRRLITLALDSTDKRVAVGKPVTPAFLFAAILWPSFSKRLEREGDLAPDEWLEAASEAAERVFSTAARRVALPRRFSSVAKEIWLLQPRFAAMGVGRARRLLRHPRFRAAYDFMLLRAEVDPELQPLAERWTQAQEVEGADFDRLFQPGRGAPKIDSAVGEGDSDSEATEGELPTPRRRRRRRRPKPAAPAPTE